MDPINASNIRHLAWLNGHPGIVGLARAIGCSRGAVYQAIRSPKKLPKVRAKLEQALPKRQ